MCVNLSPYEFNPWPIHIALSTYPNFIGNNNSNSETDFIDQKKKFYKNYQSDNHQLYSPKIYHIFGMFDLAFITLIDSYKFAQRLFDDKNDEKLKLKPINYQIITGIIPILSDNQIDKVFPIENEESNGKNSEDFVLISNLKLNNAFLIGNGHEFLKTVMAKISESLISQKFIAFFSFNWCEITLIQFGNKPDDLFKNLILIRELHFNELFKCDIQKQEIFNKSLYKQYDTLDNECDNKNVFSDTNSYLGADYYKFTKGELDKIDCLSDIELHIKPGAMGDILGHSQFDKIFDDKPYFLNGKMDLLFKKENRNKLESNKKIYAGLRGDFNGYIRRLKTSPIYNFNFGKPINKGLHVSSSIFTKLKEKHEIKNLNGLQNCLRKLKISRQIRQKVIKMYSHYNNGIVDPISYAYMIDFKPLLMEFYNFIETKAKELDSSFTKEYSFSADFVQSLESNINKILDIFENAFHVRIFNNYNFEEFNDFQIDFNSSITQLTCIFDSLVKITNDFFFNKKNIIVTHHNETTISNFVNVNYNAFDLLEPALIFNSLLKETLNATEEILESESLKYSIVSLQKVLYEKMPLLEVSEFDVRYFLYDVVKYKYLFNNDNDLYIFWSWVHMLQNSKNYDMSGNISELNFIREAFRINLVLMYFNHSEDNTPQTVKKLFKHHEAVKSAIKETKLDDDTRSKIGHIITRIEYLCSKNNQYVKISNFEINNEIKEPYSDFIKYKNFKITPTAEKSPISYYLTLANKYLNDLQVNHFENKIVVLPRCLKTGALLTNCISDEIPIYIDPFGGFYINKLDKKEKYLKLKNATIYSLLDASLKFKIALFN